MKRQPAEADRMQHKLRRSDRSRRHRVAHWHARAASDLLRLGAPARCIDLLVDIIEAMEAAR